MLKIIVSLLLMIAMQDSVIVDFKRESDTKDWVVINDGVMGGRSQGVFYLSDKGHAVFSGHISLQNNGGFSSVRYAMPVINVEKFSKVVLTIKGDGKRYQFRIKANASDYHSYITYFATNGDWQEITIPFNQMDPSFRGVKVNKAKYGGTQMEEVGFLIGNKKEEDFSLFIDKISLE